MLSKITLESARTMITNVKWWKNPVINRRAWTWEDADDRQHKGHWWQHATIYQIYPRSFQDTTGNGVGDINGIIARMDYIASLGVDAIWLCPIFESPMEDMGLAIGIYGQKCLGMG